MNREIDRTFAGKQVREMLRAGALCGVLLCGVAVADGTAQSSAAQPSSGAAIQVYRSPTCGCCGKWVEHLKQQGFQVKDEMSDNMDAIKDRLGVADGLRSCHTAVVDGHVIEGHVPADDIKRLLAEGKQAPYGLAVPGMPVGTPGMEMGARRDAYDVVGFDQGGNTSVFQHHPAAKP